MSSAEFKDAYQRGVKEEFGNETTRVLGVMSIFSYAVGGIIGNKGLWRLFDNRNTENTHVDTKNRMIHIRFQTAMEMHLGTSDCHKVNPRLKIQ